MFEVLDGSVFGKANSYLQNTQKGTHLIPTLTKFDVLRLYQSPLLVVEYIQKEFRILNGQMLKISLAVFLTSLTFDQIQE